MNEFTTSSCSKVISVNPSQKTVGAIKSGILSSMARRCRPIELNIRTMRLKTLVNIISGINKNVNMVMSGKLLLARCLAGALLICFATFNGFTSHASWFAFGIGLAFVIGFQTRITATLSALALLIVSVFKFFPDISIINASSADIFFGKMAAGIPLSWVECILTALIFTTLAFFGPGRYSADQIIRRKTFKAIKRNASNRIRRQRKQRAQNRMSYKAFLTE